MGRRWVQDEDDSVGTLLNRSPTLLVAPITGDIPELYVHLAENAGRRRGILLILNNPTAKEAKNHL